MLWWTAFSRSWTPWLPVNGYLLRHPRGLVLFDTGESIASQRADYYPGGIVGWAFRRQAQFTVDASQTLSAQLARMDIGADALERVVVSHLHQDHAGNLPEVGAVPIMVDETELAVLRGEKAAMHGMLAERVVGADTSFVPVHASALHDSWFAPFEEGFDVYGDGTLTLLPTPGHTPGSMSMVARLPGVAPLLFVGDVTYDVEVMRRGGVPGTGETALQRQTTERINALCAAHPDLVVLPAHDPSASRRLAEAGVR